MGKWISKATLIGKPVHDCLQPTKLNGEPKAGLGSIWQCDCGKKWEVKQNKVAYYPNKPNKPVLAWGMHGEKQFWLDSYLIEGEK